MGRSQETFNKKEVRSKKEKKKKEKAAKKLAKRDQEKRGSLEDMLAYVDENGNITTKKPDPSKRTEIDAENIEISVPKKETLEDMDPNRKGVVTFFNDEKGYGFIVDSETKESVFVHANNLLEPIKDNNLVDFEVEMGPKGPSAIKVKIHK